MERNLCQTCQAILPPDGRCIECVSTKPWDRAFWKRRKQEVVAGVHSCT